MAIRYFSFIKVEQMLAVHREARSMVVGYVYSLGEERTRAARVHLVSRLVHRPKLESAGRRCNTCSASCRRRPVNMSKRQLKKIAQK
jgi:hypothetical protein